MMEVLKELMEVVKDMPDMALWVLAGFGAYKLFVLGSIYGIVRLAIVKIHSGLIAASTTEVFEMCESRKTYMDLVYQIRRLRDPWTKSINNKEVEALKKLIEGGISR